eukprot:tig00000042_g15537.t1
MFAEVAMQRLEENASKRGWRASPDHETAPGAAHPFGFSGPAAAPAAPSGSSAAPAAEAFSHPFGRPPAPAPNSTASPIVTLSGGAVTERFLTPEEAGVHFHVRSRDRSRSTAPRAGAGRDRDRDRDRDSSLSESSRGSSRAGSRSGSRSGGDREDGGTGLRHLLVEDALDAVRVRALRPSEFEAI